MEPIVKLPQVEFSCCHISAGKMVSEMVSLPIVAKATEIGDRLLFKAVSPMAIGGFF